MTTYRIQDGVELELPGGDANIHIRLANSDVCPNTRRRLGEQLGLGRPATPDEFLAWLHQAIEIARVKLVQETS